MRLQFLLFFLLLSIPAHSRMVKFYGTITSSIELTSYMDEDCVKNCEYSTDCIGVTFIPFIASLICTPYLLSQITNLTLVDGSEDKSIVVLKAELPAGECPATYNDIKFTVTADTEQTISWQKVDDTTWKLMLCQDGWRRFERESGVFVCMKVFFDTYTMIKQNANYKCSLLNAVLIGVASTEELEWMQSDVQTFNEVTQSVWIDGERSKTCDSAAEFSTKIAFTWKDGLTEGVGAFTEQNRFLFYCVLGDDPRNCIAVDPWLSGDPYAWDVRCTAEFKGYVCGNELSKLAK